jgi:hypothetical protein
MSDDKRGDAVADQQREKFLKGRRETDLALTELDIRADRRSQDFDEDSAVILQEALERQKKKESDPPSGKAKAAATILKLLPEGWGRVIVVLAGMAMVTYLAGKGFKLF